ncbi:hypothetical protein [Brevibacillus parabrevis]|uniref:hypothetical protein n=1 Tax=Brevibacillus parabrevis TaxID=54914 RepID=UPI001476A2D0|nr:hypothetical protein [Brevibacillus parabrevis]
MALQLVAPIGMQHTKEKSSPTKKEAKFSPPSFLQSIPGKSLIQVHHAQVMASEPISRLPSSASTIPAVAEARNVLKLDYLSC